MYTLVIGRAFPREQTGMMGIFEFEQARVLGSKNDNSIYAFIDTRSIKRLRKLDYFTEKIDDVKVLGYHLPIGGLPPRIFAKIKGFYFKKLLNNIIKQYGKPDVIHVHFPLLTLTEGILEELVSLNVPIVVTEHWSKVQKKELEDYRLNLLGKVVEYSSMFTCVGTPLKNSVIELTQTKKNIEIIPNMISSVFRYLPKRKKDDTYEFVAVGRLVKDKNLDIMIKVFSKLFKNKNQIKLVIVGGGPQESALKALISELGMENRILLKGFLSREETAMVLQQGDAYVSASQTETFGVPYIEALACGKPIIGKRNGIIENIVNDQSGLLYNEIEELDFLLEKMYENRHAYNEPKISEEINSRYSEKVVLDQLMRIYSEVSK